MARQTKTYRNQGAWCDDDDSGGMGQDSDDELCFDRGGIVSGQSSADDGETVSKASFTRVR